MQRRLRMILGNSNKHLYVSQLPVELPDLIKAFRIQVGRGFNNIDAKEAWRKRGNNYGAVCKVCARDKIEGDKTQLKNDKDCVL